MQPFPGAGDTLPDVLQQDVRELVDWDNNAQLTWTPMDAPTGDPVDATEERWFRVRFSSTGRSFGLRLEFTLPAAAAERYLRAVLPAHLDVTECVPGRRAAVELGYRKLSELRAMLPRTARTCARLLAEFWGVTDPEEVLLHGPEYQDVLLDTSFPHLPAYRE